MRRDSITLRNFLIIYFLYMSNSLTDRWCITIFDNVPHPIVPNDEEVGYLVYQREECPTSGRLHWQCYIEFTKRKRLSTVKRWLEETQQLSKFHLEPARGQPSQNRDYCTKIDTAIDEPFEYGTIQPDREQGKRTDLHKIVEDCQNKTLVEIITETPPALRYINHITKYQAFLKKSQVRELKVIYIHGETGTGKSSYVFEKIKSKNFFRPLISPPNIWFDGYQGETILWLDDFDARDFKREFVLHLLDIYPLTLSVKGSTAQAHYTTVYITSNVEPDELDKAICRRFTKIIEK